MNPAHREDTMLVNNNINETVIVSDFIKLNFTTDFGNFRKATKYWKILFASFNALLVSTFSMY